MLCLCKVPLGCKKSTIPNWNQHLERRPTTHLHSLPCCNIYFYSVSASTLKKKKKKIDLNVQFFTATLSPKKLVWKTSICLWLSVWGISWSQELILETWTKFNFLWLRAGSTISQLPYHFTLCVGDGICPARSSCCNKAAKTVNWVSRASPGMQISLSASCLLTDPRPGCWAHPGAYASPRRAPPRRLYLTGPYKDAQILPLSTQIQ